MLSFDQTKKRFAFVCSPHSKSEFTRNLQQLNKETNKTKVNEAIQ